MTRNSSKGHSPETDTIGLRCDLAWGRLSDVIEATADELGPFTPPETTPGSGRTMQRNKFTLVLDRSPSESELDELLAAGVDDAAVENHDVILLHVESASDSLFEAIDSVTHLLESSNIRTTAVQGASAPEFETATEFDRQIAIADHLIRARAMMIRERDSDAIHLVV